MPYQNHCVENDNDNDDDDDDDNEGENDSDDHIGLVKFNDRVSLKLSERKIIFFGGYLKRLRMNLLVMVFASCALRA